MPASAAAASGVLAYAVRKLVDLLGGFSIGPTNSLASPSQMLANLAHLGPYLAQMLGVVSGADGDAGVPLALQAVHAVTALLLAAGVVWGLGRAVQGLRRGALPAGEGDEPAPPGEAAPWRLDDLLAIAVLGPTFNFVLLSRYTNASFQRYLTATVIFAAVLAGRAVTYWLTSERSDRAPRTAVRDRLAQRRWVLGAALPEKILRPATLAVAGVTAACCVVTGAIETSQPVPTEPTSRVVTFLEDHHLTAGAGDYWSASIATVESDGRVKVRPVVPDFGRLVAYSKGDIGPWFDGVRFQFVLWKGVVGTGGVSRRLAIATWGQPDHSYRVGDYRILAYPKPFEVHGVQPS